METDVIGREPGSGTRQAIERRFAEEGLRLSPHMEFEDSEAIKLAAISGLGIAYLPLHSLRLELSARERDSSSGWISVEKTMVCNASQSKTSLAGCQSFP